MRRRGSTSPQDLVLRKLGGAVSAAPLPPTDACILDLHDRGYKFREIASMTGQKCVGAIANRTRKLVRERKASV